MYRRFLRAAVVFILLPAAIHIHSQSISVPGVTSDDNLDTEEIINELVKAERAPMERMEGRVDEFQQKQQVWQEIRSRLETLRSSARTLYSFENPFDARTAVSSNESVLTASAERRAPRTTARITVQQKATPDSFLSRSLSVDTEIRPGTYGFRVGEEEATFEFDGGSLRDFAGTLNKELGRLVQARVVNDTANTQVLALEAQKTGAENNLAFLEDSRELAARTGIIEPAQDTSRELALSSDNLAAWREPAALDAVRLSEGALEVKPGGRVRVPIEPGVNVTKNMVLELDARIIDREQEIEPPPPPPPGPDTPQQGGVEFGDIRVENAPSDVVLPEREPPEPPEIVRNDQFLFAQEGTRNIELPELEDMAEFQTITIPLAEHVTTINALNIQNENTHRDLVIRNARIFDPTTRDDFKPLHPVSTAQDAKIKVDGVTVTRSSNTVDDLIEGTTLTINGESTAPVTLEVKPDQEATKNAIINFIGKYNQLIRDINILTRTNEAIIEEITYFDEQQTEQARERLGLFQGELALNQLRSRLQTIMMNAYPTGGGGGLSLLAEIGISTNASGFNTGSINQSRLRGYLEIDEERLDAALAENFSDVKKLFGHDRDGDQAVDNGAAVQLSEYVKPYVQVGGIVQSRTRTLESQISRTQEEISEYEEHLTDYRRELEEDFGEMQGAMDRLEEQQQTLQRLNSRGQE